MSCVLTSEMADTLWRNGVSLTCRFGVATGEALVGGSVPFGSAGNVSAQAVMLAEAAEPGRILIGRQTRELAAAQATSWKKPHPGLAQDEVPIKLGPVGGRLVAELFASILRGDPTSYVNAKNRFKPFPEFSHGRTFGLAELINVALGHTS